MNLNRVIQINNFIEQSHNYIRNQNVSSYDQVENQIINMLNQIYEIDENCQNH